MLCSCYILITQSSLNSSSFVLHFDDSMLTKLQRIQKGWRIIVIKNGKIVWKHGRVVDILAWTAKNGGFSEQLLSENNFVVILVTFCCYDYGGNVSETVQMIATDQKEYQKCSSCVIICWIAKIYRSINNSEKRLVTRTPPT